MEIQGYDLFLDGWLGDAAEEMTQDQRAEFGRLVRAYTQTQEGRGGEPADWAEQDNQAWIAAYEHAVGELNVSARGRAYRSAREAAYAGAVIAVLAGMSEVQAAQEATISRGTLRRALGKVRN